MGSDRSIRARPRAVLRPAFPSGTPTPRRKPVVNPARCSGASGDPVGRSAAIDRRVAGNSASASVPPEPSAPSRSEPAAAFASVPAGDGSAEGGGPFAELGGAGSDGGGVTGDGACAAACKATSSTTGNGMNRRVRISQGSSKQLIAPIIEDGACFDPFWSRVERTSSPPPLFFGRARSGAYGNAAADLFRI